MKVQIVILIIAILILLISAGVQIKAASDCSAKGGTYISGQYQLPACVQGVK